MIPALGETVQFTANHFRSDLSDAEKRDLFRCSVRYVEIELFTYCNRKCWFCPNSSMPFRQDKDGNEFMDRGLYSRILDDLASIDYRGQIQFGRYNEPLADDAILARINEARDTLPRAWLYTHTNGDFLTPLYLDELKAAGLRELKIQTYLGNNERWDETAILDRQRSQLARLGLRIRKTLTAAPGQRHFHETDNPGMLVTIDARNFDAIGTDRGGLVEIRQDRSRTAPCLIPFSNMYIDWNGNVVPCCNIRSDVAEHAEFVVSRLQDGASIFDAYAALHGWRLSLLRFGEKSGPCTTCRYDEDAVPESAAPELERIYQLAISQ
jgi:MoaA/NifB/PqqE/SkfB family radical SAM enzyme